MTYAVGTGSVDTGSVDTGMICPECSTAVTGNFCSSCGADLRAGSGLLGSVVSTAKTSVPGTYLRILRSPVKATVALAEDPTFRQHISFLLSGLAVFCLFLIPIYLRSATPPGAEHLSENVQLVLKVFSQVAIYVGTVITFLVAYGTFRLFSKEKRSLRAYFKLYCIAYGFVLPLYGSYEFLARTLVGGVGLSSFNEQLTLEQWGSASAIISATLAILLWCYFIAVHRRFWRMALWKATLLYFGAAMASYQIAWWLMAFVGLVLRGFLIEAGVTGL